MKSSCLLVLAVAALLLAPSLPAQNTGDETANPPANFKKVSTLVRLPDWLPGLGTLYVDPASLPAGPYLGYNRRGTEYGRRTEKRDRSIGCTDTTGRLPDYLRWSHAKAYAIPLA